MSVTTTADERITSSKGHVQLALENLNDVVIQKVWGADEFSAEYRAQLRNWHQRLLELRDEMQA